MTKVYNRFHNPDEIENDITELRELHRQLDTAVVAAYDWTDLAASKGAALLHGFHETKQGVRYTISEFARRTVLDRLLALNHQRYAGEVAAGLHDKMSKRSASATRRRRKTSDPEPEPEFFE
jgi:hypothetical protein